MNSSQLLVFALLAVSISCQPVYSINLNRTQYPVAQPLSSNQNTTNLCYFSGQVSLTPIQAISQKGNFSGFAIDGSTNQIKNCQVPKKLTFVKSSTDYTPQAVNGTANSTDFNSIYVVDDVSVQKPFKLINSISNSNTLNLSLYVYHNDSGLDTRVQQILKLVASSASSLMVTLIFGLLALLF
ncbi:hypothetical protein ABPG74_002126 [Tetrahymena malaccensis]